MRRRELERAQAGEVGDERRRALLEFERDELQAANRLTPIVKDALRFEFNGRTLQELVSAGRKDVTELGAVTLPETPGTSSPRSMCGTTWPYAGFLLGTA